MTGRRTQPLAATLLALVALGLAAWALAGAPARAASPAAAPAATPAPPKSDGAALFASLCAPCHAKDGSGHTPLGRTWGVPDMRSPDWQSSRSDDALAAVIRGGRTGTRMRPFGARLSDAELTALVRRIRALR